MQSFRPSLAISAVFHAIILLWGLISFAPKPLDVVRMETMAIDLVPISEFTMNKAGTNKAPPKPDKVAETKGDPKELTDLVQKVTEKQEIKAAAPPPPAEEQKPPEAKVEDKKPEAKPDPKPDPKEALKTPEPPKKPEPPKEQPKAAAQMKAAPTKRDFDPNKIAALLDRREPQRQKVSDLQNLTMPTAGVLHGQAAMLSQTEIDALKQRLKQCWNPPAGAADAGYVTVRVALRRDGSVAAPPELVAGTPSAAFMGDSAKRAILTCQPFTMLKPEHYDQWSVLDLKFDPNDM